MRDFIRLRDYLRTALLLAPLAACGSSQRPMQIAKDDHAVTPDAAPPADAAATPDVLAPPKRTHPRSYQPGDGGCSHQCPGGRPLVIDGHAVVAVLRGPVARPDDPDLRAVLAEGWLMDALAEHASIASFARATLELMALGARLDLLDGTARAMRDEVRHAKLCFELAARHGARASLPGPLAAAAPRAAELAQLACDTFIEGCVGETVSALGAARALAGCRDDAVSRVVRGIAVDESRHAALAWRTIAWAIAEGGEPVIAALRGCAVRPVDRGGTNDPRLAAHGRLDGEAACRAEQDAWREIIGPTLDELCARFGGARA